MDNELLCESESDGDAASTGKLQNQKNTRRLSLCKLLDRLCTCSHRVCLSQFSQRKSQVQAARDKFNELEWADKICFLKKTFNLQRHDHRTDTTSTCDNDDSVDEVLDETDDDDHDEILPESCSEDEILYETDSDADTTHPPRFPARDSTLLGKPIFQFSWAKKCAKRLCKA